MADIYKWQVCLCTCMFNVYIIVLYLQAKYIKLELGLYSCERESRIAVKVTVYSLISRVHKHFISIQNIGLQVLEIFTSVFT